MRSTATSICAGEQGNERDQGGNGTGRRPTDALCTLSHPYHEGGGPVLRLKGALNEILDVAAVLGGAMGSCE